MIVVSALRLGYLSPSKSSGLVQLPLEFIHSLKVYVLRTDLELPVSYTITISGVRRPAIILSQKTTGRRIISHFDVTSSCGAFR